MSEGSDQNRSETLRDQLIRFLPLHMIVYGVVATIAAIIQIVFPVSFSLLKPMLIWVILLIAHYLYVRAVNIDPEWADERSETIALNATDLSHIDDIKQRFEEKQRESKEVDADETSSNPQNRDGS